MCINIVISFYFKDSLLLPLFIFHFQPQSILVFKFCRNVFMREKKCTLFKKKLIYNTKKIWKNYSKSDVFDYKIINN